MERAETLAAWPEARVLRAMRGWRRGAGPLEPWFRATPFASAHHYRDRSLAIAAGDGAPMTVRRLRRLFPAPRAAALWILDLPGPIALWTAYALRRHLGMAVALDWHGWYDPRGVLDGRREIPLLLALGVRLARVPVRRRPCLVLDSLRQTTRRPGAFDNRYLLGEEDAPGREHLRAIGIRRVLAWVWRTPGEDLTAYLAYLARDLETVVREDVEREVAGHD